MKRSLMHISLLALVGAIASQAEDAIPPRFNFDRYSAMLDRSPFAVATAVALPSATPDFAKDLYVANAARSSEGDLVTIASSSDQSFKKYLSTRQPVDGYSIASIEWSDRVGATKVTISKDGNFATISFNEALLSQPLTNAPPAPRPANPIARSPLTPPPAIPRQTPRPHVRGMIQRNPKAMSTPTPNPAPLRVPRSATDRYPGSSRGQGLIIDQLQA
jgi:hypothetical protein